MKPTQRIDLLTTIKGTLVSFFSIFMFVTLGVGVFLGIHWLSGSLHTMADDALAAGHAHDLEITYLYGLTDDDLDKLADVEGVDEVEAGYVAYGQLENGDETFVLKFHTLPRSIDTFITQQGELPSDSAHVAVERTWAIKSGFKIGDTIKLAKQKDGASNGLTRRTFKISAFVTSPSYLGTDNATYGASDLGDGGVNGGTCRDRAESGGDNGEGCKSTLHDGSLLLVGIHYAKSGSGIKAQFKHKKTVFLNNSVADGRGVLVECPLGPRGHSTKTPPHICQ